MVKYYFFPSLALQQQNCGREADKVVQSDSITLRLVQGVCNLAKTVETVASHLNLVQL